MLGALSVGDWQGPRDREPQDLLFSSSMPMPWITSRQVSLSGPWSNIDPGSILLISSQNGAKSDKLDLYKYLYVTYSNIINKQFNNTLLVSFHYCSSADHHRHSIGPMYNTPNSRVSMVVEDCCSLVWAPAARQQVIKVMVLLAVQCGGYFAGLKRTHSSITFKHTIATVVARHI